jgi:hypothetical protein
LKLTPNFVLYGFNDRNKISKISILEIEKQIKKERGDKIVAIILIALLLFMFLAPNLEIMLFFLFSGLLIGCLHLKKRRH